MAEHVTSNQEVDETARAGNPAGESAEHLAGDLGISSEREAPFEGIDGTGTAGTAVDHTDGTLETHPEVTGQPDTHPQDPAEGPAPDAPAEDEPGQNGDAPRRHAEDPAEGPDDTARRVAERAEAQSREWGTSEVNAADAPPQPFDPARNPGHSHG